ncbi:MAG: hypothetical protein ABSB95_16555 [Dissulfurispiraceae bacterium]|jgi:hypothetical protein
MKISHIALMTIVAMSSCPAWAEDVYPSGPTSGQSALYGTNSADSQQFTPGPSSSNVRSRPAANSTVYPPTSYPPTSYQPSVYPPGTYPPTSYPSATNSQQYQNLAPQPNAVPVQPDIVMPALGNRLVESTWYTRVDYFHWNEQMDSMAPVNEYGTLLTLGYMRRIGIERFHVAVFGATMRYQGYGQFENDDGSYYTEPLSSATGYLGALGEYDLHIEPDCCPDISFFVGIGTRFWIRDLKDGVSDYGNPVPGYQETWWTIYPYLGLEKKRLLNGGWEFYYAGRIGCTAMTYQFASIGYVPLYPKAGLTGQLEIGLRGQTAFISAFTEIMTWSQSDVVEGYLQPNSQMLTFGIKTGFCF